MNFETVKAMLLSGEGEAVRVASPADGSGTHHLGNPQSDVEHGLLSGRVIW